MGLLQQLRCKHLLCHFRCCLGHCLLYLYICTQPWGCLQAAHVQPWGCWQAAYSHVVSVSGTCCASCGESPRPWAYTHQHYTSTGLCDLLFIAGHLSGCVSWFGGENALQFRCQWSQCQPQDRRASQKSRQDLTKGLCICFSLCCQECIMGLSPNEVIQF